VSDPKAPAAPPADDHLWDIDEAAAFLNVSKAWVYRRTAAGTIPCVRLSSGLIRFVPETLKSWAQGNEQGGGRVARLPRRSK